MPKAVETTTTNVVALPSRSRNPVDAIPEVQAAHNKLIAIIAASRPHPIYGPAAHRFDIMRRRDHLSAVLRAVTDYAKVVVEDTANLAPMDYIADETGFLEDAVSTIYFAFDEAVNRLIEDQDAAY